MHRFTTPPAPRAVLASLFVFVFLVLPAELGPAGWGRPRRPAGAAWGCCSSSAGRLHTAGPATPRHAGAAWQLLVVVLCSAIGYRFRLGPSSSQKQPAWTAASWRPIPAHGLRRGVRLPAGSALAALATQEDVCSSRAHPRPAPREARGFLDHSGPAPLRASRAILFLILGPGAARHRALLQRHPPRPAPSTCVPLTKRKSPSRPGHAGPCGACRVASFPFTRQPH